MFTKLKETILKHKKTLLMVTSVILATILLQTTIAILLSTTSNFHLPSLGTIHTLNVEVYGKDVQEKNGEKYIEWGILYPGTQINRTFTVKSKSNVEGILIIKATNWTLYNSKNETVLGPTDKMKYINILPPKQNETILKPDETIELTITLNATASKEFIEYILENDVQTFTFDLHIYLTEKT